MEIVQKVMSGFSLDLGPVKEPLGFIRILEWIFTICAFATTGGYVGSTTFSLTCAAKENDIVAHFGYPFRLPSKSYEIVHCNGTKNVTYLQGDFSSSSEFFVSVGVLGFLYCTFTLILYLGYQHVYRDPNRSGPTIDLILTGIFAFLWLVCSSAWGKGLTDVKYATDPTRLIKHCLPEDNCVMKSYPSMGRLNSSVLFGFLNLILWAGNCWFIYKETSFHKPQIPAATAEEGVSSS